MRLEFQVAMILAAAGAASAETLQDLRQRVAGSEIDIAGHIGTGFALMDDEALAFRDAEGNFYPVIFDAGRDARRKLEGCKFAMFGGGSPCTMSGKAEIELNGSRVRLIVFEVSDIAGPAPLQ